MRKNVIAAKDRYIHKGPRTGETCQEYYKNVTQLAKDYISKEISEAWQYITTFYADDIKEYIIKELTVKLNNMDNEKLYHDDTIIYKKFGVWYEYHDYTNFEIEPQKLTRLEKFL